MDYSRIAAKQTKKNKQTQMCKITQKNITIPRMSCPSQGNNTRNRFKLFMYLCGGGGGAKSPSWARKKNTSVSLPFFRWKIGLQKSQTTASRGVFFLHVASVWLTFSIEDDTEICGVKLIFNYNLGHEVTFGLCWDFFDYFLFAVIRLIFIFVTI